jgi:hypothetical protein
MINKQILFSVRSDWLLWLCRKSPAVDHFVFDHDGYTDLRSKEGEADREIIELCGELELFRTSI